MRLEHWWYAIPLRLRSLFRRKRVEQELEEEFRFHFDQLVAQEMAASKTVEEARRAAYRAMDGIERQKENCRDMRRVPYIESLVDDFRQGFRAIVRTPRFAAAVIDSRPGSRSEHRGLQCGGRGAVAAAAVSACG